MEQEKKTIMVTWDFSIVSYHALRHAIKLAHILKNNIVLFHIDPQTGKLSPTGHVTEVPVPVCIKLIPSRS